MSTGGFPHRLRGRGLGVAPTTSLGRWAVGLAVASLMLLSAWKFLGPLGGFPGLALGAAGGVVALVAITRRRERGVSVYAAVVLLVNAVAMVLGELLAGG